MARIALLLLLAGCTPYARLGLGYQLDEYTDYWQQTERDWQCDSPSFHGEIGLRNRHYGIALAHDSWLLCGSFNNRPESYANRIEVWAEISGKDRP